MRSSLTETHLDTLLLLSKPALILVQFLLAYNMAHFASILESN